MRNDRWRLPDCEGGALSAGELSTWRVDFWSGNSRDDVAHSLAIFPKDTLKVYNTNDFCTHPIFEEK